jgi:glutamate racemase
MHIGIFDSGIGGLTVASEIKRLMPNIQITYFGDTAHLPYGDKSQELICSYSDAICAFLIQQGCKTIVIACNTASALAYAYLKDKYSEINFVSVINPVVDYCVANNLSSLSLIATKGTVKSKAYLNKLQSEIPDVKLHQIATPLLVPIIEENMENTLVSNEVLKLYLINKEVKSSQGLILGCTHYPVLKEEIKRILKVEVIDGSIIVAKYLADKFSEMDAALTPDRFFMSDYTDVFQDMAQRFFGANVSLTAIKL